MSEPSIFQSPAPGSAAETFDKGHDPLIRALEDLAQDWTDADVLFQIASYTMCSVQHPSRKKLSAETKKAARILDLSFDKKVTCPHRLTIGNLRTPNAVGNFLTGLHTTGNDIHTRFVLCQDNSIRGCKEHFSVDDEGAARCRLFLQHVMLIEFGIPPAEIIALMFGSAALA